MVRCPGCSHWQELRAFRIGSTRNHWVPATVSACEFRNWDESENTITDTFIDGLSCNHCFAKYHGRSNLAEVLVKWLDYCLDSERVRLAFMLSAAWDRLGKQYRKFERVSSIYEVKDVVLDILPVAAKLKTHDFHNIGLTEILTLRMAFPKWVTAWGNLDHETRSFVEHSTWNESCKNFHLWFENYHAIEAHLVWVIQCEMEMAEKDRGDDLTDWVLSREGRTLT